MLLLLPTVTRSRRPQRCRATSATIAPNHERAMVTDHRGSLCDTASAACQHREHEHDQDAGCIEALMYKFTPMVRSVAARVLADPDARADAIQQTWIRAWRSLGRRHSRAATSTWLYLIAHRTALNAKRDATLRRARESAAATLEERCGVPVTDRQLSTRLRGLIASLPPRQRTILLAHVLEQYTHEEIALALGCTAATSRSHLLRARRTLRRRIAKPEQGSTH